MASAHTSRKGSSKESDDEGEESRVTDSKTRGKPKNPGDILDMFASKGINNDGDIESATDEVLASILEDYNRKYTNKQRDELVRKVTLIYLKAKLEKTSSSSLDKLQNQLKWAKDSVQKKFDSSKKTVTGKIGSFSGKEKQQKASDVHRNDTNENRSEATPDATDNIAKTDTQKGHKESHQQAAQGKDVRKHSGSSTNWYSQNDTTDDQKRNSDMRDDHKEERSDDRQFNTAHQHSPGNSNRESMKSDEVSGHRDSASEQRLKIGDDQSKTSQPEKPLRAKSIFNSSQSDQTSDLSDNISERFDIGDEKSESSHQQSTYKGKRELNSVKINQTIDKDSISKQHINMGNEKSTVSHQENPDRSKIKHGSPQSHQRTGQDSIDEQRSNMGNEKSTVSHQENPDQSKINLGSHQSHQTTGQDSISEQSINMGNEKSTADPSKTETATGSTEFRKHKKPEGDEGLDHLGKRQSSVITIEDIKSEDDITKLSVRQLKMILMTNKMDCENILERKEFETLVKSLWEETKNQNKDSSDPTDEICKICLTSKIDCALIECGHLVVCIECGQKIQECPVCRAYVTRIIRIFRK